MESEDFFITCYAEIRKDLYRFLSRHTASHEEAEDLLQEVFAEAFRKRELLCSHPEPRGFLFCIAKNKLKKAARLQMIKLEHEQEMKEICSAEETPDEFSRFLLYHSLKRILKREELELLDYYCIKGYTSKEVAKHLGITDALVRKRFALLKRKLHKEFRI